MRGQKRIGILEIRESEEGEIGVGWRGRGGEGRSRGEGGRGRRSGRGVEDFGEDEEELASGCFYCFHYLLVFFVEGSVGEKTARGHDSIQWAATKKKRRGEGENVRRGKEETTRKRETKLGKKEELK